jgi:hypothetical protein
MVQIYNKNRVIQDRYCQVLKTKKVRNSLSFTPFPMDVYRYLSILTLLSLFCLCAMCNFRFHRDKHK